MWYASVVAIFVFFAQNGFTRAQGVFNMTEYFRMPALNRLQNFEKCLEGTHDLAVFCRTTTFIKPTPGNPVWNIIEKFSSDWKRHYRHDVQQSGICINWCQDELSSLDTNQLQALDVQKFQTNYNYSLNLAAFNGTPEYRNQYGKVVNQCINHFLKENYNLSGYSEIIYCTTNKEEKPVDGLDLTFLIVLGFIIALVVSATVYDSFLNTTPCHYEKTDAIDKLSVRAQVLLAFSLPRNWYRLISQPTSEESRLLRYIQGFRFITIYLIVWGHALIGFTLGFINNPYKYEEVFHSVYAQVQLNAFSIVQVFFSISGVLMGYQFGEMTGKRKFKLNYFWIGIVYRYLRLTPVYLFWMLFDATWLYKMQNGPGWKRLAETERYNCRTNMWTNLLYINNYVNVSDGCMPVTWYLAVDMQMFIIGLAVMMLIWRFPHLKKRILACCIIISVTVPALITYFRKFDGIFLLTAEDRKYMQYTRAFIETYVPVHTNMGNYFFGIVTGLYCHHVRSNKIELTQGRKKFILWGAYLAPVVSAIVAMTFYIFYAYDFPKPSVWMALFSMFTKNLWGFFGVFTTCAYLLQIEKFLINLLQMKIFQPLGRLTYCIFLCHFDLMRIFAATSREHVYASNLLVGISALTVYFFATLLGLLLCLSLEFPITAMLKQFLKRDPEARKEFEKRKAIELQATDSNGNFLCGLNNSLEASKTV